MHETSSINIILKVKKIESSSTKIRNKTKVILLPFPLISQLGFSKNNETREIKNWYIDLPTYDLILDEENPKYLT